jgi:hypothetical protein
MDRPTVDQLQAISPFLLERADADLEPLANEAAAIASMLTARIIGPVSGETSFGCPFEEVPEWLQPVATRAVASMMEVAVNSVSLASRTKAGSKELASFTAGPYSESYFSPEIAAKAMRLHPDQLVNDSLMALLTACARAYWLRVWGVEEAGVGAGAAMQFDYRGRPGGYAY